MRRFPFSPTLMFALASLVSPAFGWWDGGHMQIAYVAFEKLDHRSQSEGGCVAPV